MSRRRSRGQGGEGRERISSRFCPNTELDEGLIPTK